MLALDFLSSLGNVRSVCFLPASYARKRPSNGASGNALMETEALETLNLLIGSNRIILVPPDSHDDLFILSYGNLCIAHLLYSSTHFIYLDTVKLAET